MTGGKRPDGFDKGFFYEPTVFVGTNDMRIAQEEIFGPVLTVIPYSGTDDDAVRLANDSIYGLGGGVVAATTARAFNVARRIRAGYMNAQGSAAPAHRRRPRRRPGPGLGTRPWPASARAAPSAASSRAASAASGATTASRSSPRSSPSAGADPSAVQDARQGATEPPSARERGDRRAGAIGHAVALWRDVDVGRLGAAVHPLCTAHASRWANGSKL